MKSMLPIKNSTATSPWRDWVAMGFFLLVLWVVLVEGRLHGLWFAIPVLALALAVRRAMPIPLSLRNISLVQFVRFIPYFLWQSLVGGVDVGWRAMHPSLPVHPNIYSYPYQVHSEGARVFMAQVISLMPGTLACRVGEHRMIVHVLSGSRESFVADTAILEKWAARIFREKLEGARHG